MRVIFQSRRELGGCAGLCGPLPSPAVAKSAGRRYARWQLWQDKILYLLFLGLFLLWLEWTVHGGQTWPAQSGRTQPAQQATLNISRHLGLSLLGETVDLLQTFPLVRGRCGPRFLLPSGAPAVCPSAATCCSARGWCSSSPDDCLCDDCIYYEWEEMKKLMPEQLPLEDDNSDFTLLGYQNFLIEPQVGCRASHACLSPAFSDRLRRLQDDHYCLHGHPQLPLQVSGSAAARADCGCRQMIRLTWGNDRYLSQINATLLFVVGRFPNLKVQWRLEQEGRKYQDILQGDFFEDYFLLAYKSLTWMLWTKLKCSKVPWIVKTDDDMINNIWKLGGLVEALKYQRNTITCSTKTERVIRQKTGTRIDKWVSMPRHRCSTLTQNSIHFSLVRSLFSRVSIGLRKKKSVNWW